MRHDSEALSVGAPMNDLGDLLTISEAAAQLRVCSRTVWNLIRDEKLVARRPLGLRVTLIEVASVGKLLESSRPSARVVRKKGDAKWNI